MQYVPRCSVSRFRPRFPASRRLFRPRGCRGFSLLELLIVLGVIALLGALLFPVFSRAREKARQGTCQSNLRQTGLAILQYVQDNDDRLPPGTQLEPSPYMGTGWATNVAPYLRNHNMLHCPSDGVSADPNRLPVSYAYNQSLVRSNSTNVLTRLNLSQFTSPPQTVLCFEVRHGLFDKRDPLDNESPCGNGVGLWGGNRGNAAYNLQYATGPLDSFGGDSSNNNIADNGETFPAMHMEGANYLAVDGHVKWQPPRFVSAGWYANTPGAAGGAGIAQGITYAGLGKKALTFSYK